MKSRFIKNVLVLGFIAVSPCVNAQLSNSYSQSNTYQQQANNGPNAIDQPGAAPDIPPDPEDIPIDGGLSILLAAGLGYGVKKAYNKRK